MTLGPSWAVMAANTESDDWCYWESQDQQPRMGNTIIESRSGRDRNAVIFE